MSQESVVIAGGKVQISSFGLISEAWQIFKNNWTQILGFFIVVGLVQIVYQAADQLMVEWDESGLMFMAFNIASMFFDAFITAGTVFVTLKIVRGQQFAVKELFSQSGLIFKYFFGTLLYGLLVILGLVLLIIPGIYWSLKYWPVTYLLVDKKMGIKEAFGVAGRMTQGTKWKTIVFGLVCVGVAILGLLALVVGLLAAVPVISIAFALLYVKLLPRVEQKAQAVAKA